MGKRAKKPEVYRNGDTTLGRANGYYVASFDHLGRRKRKQLCPISAGEIEAKKHLDVFATSRLTLKASLSKLTVGELWKMWLEERAKDGFSNAVYDHNWKSLSGTFSNRMPHLITTDTCRAYAKGRFDQGMASATVHTELSRLRSCIKWGYDNNHLADKPPKIWVPSAGKPRERVLTPDEAVRLLSAARDGDPHVYLFTVLLFATSGRHTAILDLMWTRVDFVSSTIELDVDIPPDPMSRSWRKGRAKMWMSNLAREALREAYPGRLTPYVIEHGGKRLKSCREGFTNAVTRAGLKDVTPHTIRHTVATWTYGSVETKITAQLLGHGDERTTSGVYQHPDASMTRSAVEVIDSTLATLPVSGLSSRTKAARKDKIEPVVSETDRDAETPNLPANEIN